MTEVQDLAAPEFNITNGELPGNGLAPTNFYPQQSGDPKPSFPPSAPTQLVVAKAGHKKRARSDSDLSDIAEEDAGSDFEGEDSADSQDSFTRRAKRKREAEERDQHRFRQPEDNEMRQKLRGRFQATASATEDDSRAASLARGSASETEDLTENETDPTLIPDRPISAEEEAEQKEKLKTSWELVAILDFLHTFQPYLNLTHLNFSAEELESSLVLSNGSTGLLPELHMGIMRGISTRSNLQKGNWAASLSEKLKLYWRVGRLPGVPPFKPQRRWEAVDYARLPLEDRVTALRILCELRLEKDDLHNVVEHAIHPPRKTKAEKKAAALAAAQGRRRNAPPEPPPPTMEQMRKQPLAKDSSGLMYWYLDYHTTTGTRLYRETPGSLLKGKGKKQSEPQWELLAATPEDLTELGERLRRSKKKPDQNLASLILDKIVAELLERREADFKRQRAAAKLQAQMNNILPTGRSRRARKEVNYSFDAYDAAIRAALRQGSSEPEGRPTRSSRFTEARLYRMTAEEEAELGLRRGRSARAASPPLELPPTRRVKQSEGTSKDVTPEWESTPPVDPPSRTASPEEFDTRDPAPEVGAETMHYPNADHGALPAVNGSNGWQDSGYHGRFAAYSGSPSGEVEISVSDEDREYQDVGYVESEPDIAESSEDQDLGMLDDPKDKDWR